MIKKFSQSQNSLKKFFKKKIDFYSDKNNKVNNLLFIDRERLDTIFPFSILSLALSNKYNLNTIILSDQPEQSLTLKVFKKLGYKKFISGFSFKKIFTSPIIFVCVLFYFIYSVLNTYIHGFNWLINKFNINKIYFGDLIYDSNIRYRHRFLKPRIDLYFLKLLFSSIFRFFIIKKALTKLKIKKILIGTETGSRNHGIALRISSKMNIKNYGYFIFSKNIISTISYKKDYYLNGIVSLSKKEFLKISNNISQSKINTFYDNRKKLKTNNLYTSSDYKTANMKDYKGMNFLNQISKMKKKKILFACHTFSDAPHHSGKFVFNDYFEQFKDTLKFAYDKGDENVWIFRSHPTTKMYDEEKIFFEEISNYKKKNIFLCPKNVPIQKLLDLCDTVITGRGTIGLESAALGKKVITAGSAPYSNLDIVFQANSKEEYFYYLKNLKKIKKKIPLSKIKKISKKLIYIFENLLNYKTIKIEELSKDKSFFRYINKVYSKKSNLNSIFADFTAMLSNNILKSKIYNKLLKMI